MELTFLLYLPGPDTNICDEPNIKKKNNVTNARALTLALV